MPNKNGLHLITPTSVSISGGSGSATISANGSVSFSNFWGDMSFNGVFSADYDNYMIVCHYAPDTTSTGSANFRLRASGVDNTTASSYTQQQLTANGTSITTSRTASTATSFWNFGNTTSGTIAYLYGPYLSQPTVCRNLSASQQGGAMMQDVAFTHNQSTSYDGFTINFISGGYVAQSGRVAVYGMRN